MKNDKDKPNPQQFYWDGLMQIAPLRLRDIIDSYISFTNTLKLTDLYFLLSTIICKDILKQAHIEELMYIYYVGAKKYGDKNYLGLEIQRIVNSMGRHLIQMVFIKNDEESGYSHMAHFLANILIAAEILSKN